MSYDNPPREYPEKPDLTDSETVDALREDQMICEQFLLYKLNETTSNINSALEELQNMRRRHYKIPYKEVNEAFKGINDAMANFSKKALE